jgi:hypothetical protein
MIWHRTPVELVLDIAHGPVETSSWPPKAKQTLRHSWGELYLAALFPGSQTSWSSYSAHDTESVSVQFDPLPPEANGFVSVWIGWPQAHPLPLDLEFLFNEGQSVLLGGSSSGMMMTANSNMPLAELSEIRVRQYSQVKRLIFRLPEIPGLPGENRAVTNLFDLQIPYVHLRDPDDFRNLITRTVQMEFANDLVIQFPPDYFPKSFTQITPRELLQEYASHFPGQKKIRIDQEKFSIQVRDPFLTGLLNRLTRLTPQ